MRNSHQKRKYGHKLPPANQPKYDFTNNHLYLDDVEGEEQVRDHENKIDHNYIRRHQDQNYRRARDEQSAKDSAKENHTGKLPKGYQRTDERIYEEVCEALTAHPEIDPSEVEVKVSDGIVMFSGTVENRQTKRLIEDIVEHISGVCDIRNDLTFKQPTKLNKKK